MERFGTHRLCLTVANINRDFYTKAYKMLKGTVKPNDWKGDGMSAAAFKLF